MQLDEETLKYLGIMDENGNLIKEECATQVVAEPTDKMFLANPLKEGDEGQLDKNETVEEKEDSKEDSKQEENPSKDVKQIQKKRLILKKKEEKETKKECLGDFIGCEPEIVGQPKIQSVFDELANWPVLANEGVEVTLLEDTEDFEIFVISYPTGVEAEYTVYGDGTVKQFYLTETPFEKESVTKHNFIRFTLDITQTAGAIKQEILDCLSAIFETEYEEELKKEPMDFSSKKIGTSDAKQRADEHTNVVKEETKYIGRKLPIIRKIKK